MTPNTAITANLLTYLHHINRGKGNQGIGPKLIFLPRYLVCQNQSFINDVGAVWGVIYKLLQLTTSYELVLETKR